MKKLMAKKVLVAATAAATVMSSLAGCGEVRNTLHSVITSDKGV